ncbi:MAG: LytTR family DNA-binding domain-containing protein [Bacteroidetes bacterium]|nr:LytTR family DNA-binding domain-containing protein [Bacteroidota bacterium]
MITVILVDDDPRQHKVVKNILSGFDTLKLSAAFFNAEEAYDYLQTHPVDIALLDIEMPGKDGLWLAEKISKTDTAIFFLTAHSQYAIKAFEVFAMHYILKPITTELMRGLIDRYVQLKNSNSLSTHLQSQQIDQFVNNFVKKQSYLTRIFVSNVKVTTIINLDDVLFFTASGPYTEIMTIGGKKLTASKILKAYADILEDHPDFIRVHRANIVNRKHVKAILKDRHIIELLMKDGSKLPVSPQKRDEILNMIVF